MNHYICSIPSPAFSSSEFDAINDECAANFFKAETKKHNSKSASLYKSRKSESCLVAFVENSEFYWR